MHCLVQVFPSSLFLWISFLIFFKLYLQLRFHVENKRKVPIVTTPKIISELHIWPCYSPCLNPPWIPINYRVKSKFVNLEEQVLLHIGPFQFYFALSSFPSTLICPCVIKVFTYLWLLDLVMAFHDILCFFSLPSCMIVKLWVPLVIHATLIFPSYSLLLRPLHLEDLSFSIYSSNWYLLSTYYVPRVVLCASFNLYN